MEDFLYSLTSGEWAGQLNAKSVLEAVLTAAAIGLIISLVYLFTHKKRAIHRHSVFRLYSCTDCCNGYSCYRQQCCHGILTCRCIRTCSFQKRTRRPKGYSICVYVGYNGSYLWPWLPDLGFPCSCRFVRNHFDFAFHKLCRQKVGELRVENYRSRNIKLCRCI